MFAFSFGHRGPLKEALTDAIYAGFAEDRKGSIEPGKLADRVVIDRDILTIPGDQNEDIKVEMTLIGGRVV